MQTVKITLTEDRKCVECGNGWASQGGFCLKCVNKALKWKPMKSAAGRALQAHYRKLFEKK